MPDAGPAKGTRRSALLAVVLSGTAAAFLAGLADAIHAFWRFSQIRPDWRGPSHPEGAVDLLFGAAGATTLMLPIALAGALLGMLIAKGAPVQATRSVMVGFAALGALFPLVFLLVFDGTREQIFPGLPATDARRLVATAGVGLACLAGSMGLALGLVRAPRVLLAGLAFLGGIAAIGGLAYRQTEAAQVQARGEITNNNRELPNVVLFVIDALRADALGCYGNAIVKTPHIDGIAERGVLFEQALTQAPYTLTSFGSLFTGKYPRRHGLMKMAPGVRMEDNLTFAELLKSAELSTGDQLDEYAYASGAFLTGAMSHGSGLAEGFDSYSEVMMGHPRVDLDSRWSIFRSKLALPRLLEKVRAKRNPDHLIDTARGFIAENRDRRFCALVHLYSTHTPYNPPEPYRSQYVHPDYDGPISMFDAAARRAIERGEYLPEDQDILQVLHLYQGGVALADHHVGLIVDDLRRLGLLENTLIAVTSDHGEDFGEGGRWEHSHMYRSNLHVPLVMSWPKGIPKGVRVTGDVESVDFLPTLADYLDLQIPVSHGPRDAIDGQSLRPLMEGEGALKPYTFAEDATFVSICDGRYMLVMERYAIAEDGWQLVLDEQIGQVRFHDLETDPLQRRDLFEAIIRGPDDVSEETRSRVMGEVERLRSAWLAWNEHQPISVESVVQSDRDLENAVVQALQNSGGAAEVAILQALGYLDAGDRTTYSGQLRDRLAELRGEAEPAPPREVE